MRQRPKALTYAVFGAKGTGKTAYIKQLIQQATPHRLAIFDPKGDPSLRDMGTAYTWDQRAAFARAMLAKSFAVRLIPDYGGDLVAQFEFFCACVWAAGNLWMFVDELPEVTKANKAPPGWRRCVNVGRLYTLHDGTESSLTIIGAGQRMAECDKSIISNADVIHTGRLANVADAKLMAQTLGVSPEDVLQLPDLHWIEKRATVIEAARGVLTFDNAKPPKAEKKTAPPPGRKTRP